MSWHTGQWDCRTTSVSFCQNKFKNIVFTMKWRTVNNMWKCRKKNDMWAWISELLQCGTMGTVAKIKYMFVKQRFYNATKEHQKIGGICIDLLSIDVNSWKPATKSRMRVVPAYHHFRSVKATYVLIELFAYKITEQRKTYIKAMANIINKTIGWQ